MTKHADEIFRLVVKHYRELAGLREADADTFQDTVLWMAEHTRTLPRNFIRAFCMRFKFLRIENIRRHIPLTYDVGDDAEPYVEKTSDISDTELINNIRNAISEEEKETETGV